MCVVATNHSHWAPARDLNPLSSEDIEAFLGSTQKKSGELVKAYKIARDPRVWNEQMNKVVKEAEEEEESDRKRKPRSGPARKSEPKKQRVESEAKLDEAPATREETEDEMDPQTRKVREWRHKLQRAFLNKDGVIVAEDMKNQDETFKIVEAYTEMTPEQLRATKIGKVMRRIHQLGEVPRDDEFHFKSRAGELMNRWSAILGAH
ncbi:hypothetical protein MVES1_002637 [Malassezia vespertilionis]|uniref:uncharacterized protein n=1 Tax=Malassezia vespertilionis TaxID=2020962 RepID=UPI0024B1EDC1|nr:uncharacterized protein MVES1_002637 [Malassezia vespertilionis]WFD07277.1 hypothetical protein MVES1_002637 [Malassezia vespertilionis]